MTNFHITHCNEVVHWEEIPFAFEHAMAGYILENYNILRLNDDSLSKVTITGYEVPIGNKSNRADITVSYGDGDVITARGIVELKNVTAKNKELEQLQHYLDIAKQKKLGYDLGVLVAPNFDFDVIQKIKKSQNLYGIKISRYESNNEYVVVADIIYPEFHKKDYTRYNLMSLQGITIENLSKARLAWYIVDSYVQATLNITFDDLTNIFEDKIQNRHNSSIHLVEKEKDAVGKLRCRYSTQPISLADGTNVVVSNQWNPESIQAMIDVATKLNMSIIE